MSVSFEGMFFVTANHSKSWKDGNVSSMFLFLFYDDFKYETSEIKHILCMQFALISTEKSKRLSEQTVY